VDGAGATPAPPRREDRDGACTALDDDPVLDRDRRACLEPDLGFVPVVESGVGALSLTLLAPEPVLFASLRAVAFAATAVRAAVPAAAVMAIPMVATRARRRILRRGVSFMLPRSLDVAQAFRKGP
jgi:hypothetical protein